MKLRLLALIAAAPSVAARSLATVSSVRTLARLLAWASSGGPVALAGKIRLGHEPGPSEPRSPSNAGLGGRQSFCGRGAHQVRSPFS